MDKHDDWGGLRFNNTEKHESWKRKLLTHSMNEVLVMDDIDQQNGGVSHDYQVCLIIKEDDQGVIRGGARICFQRGPRKELGSERGVQEDDLLAIIQDRLECFQAGAYASAYNQRALEAVREARNALQERAADRAKRGVLGINQK